MYYKTQKISQDTIDYCKKNSIGDDNAYDMRSLTVVQLKLEISARDLDITGRKDVLLARIVSAYMRENRKPEDGETAS